MTTKHICPHCQRELDKVRLVPAVWACAHCAETWHLPVLTKDQLKMRVTVVETPVEDHQLLKRYMAHVMEQTQYFWLPGSLACNKCKLSDADMAELVKIADQLQQEEVARLLRLTGGGS